MRDRDVARLKDLLGPVGKKLRLEDPVAAGSLWRRWPQIVGDDIARNVEPTSLKEGVLRVRTSSPTWATEMSYLAGDIKERVNEALGKPLVREIKVWTSPAPIGRARRGSDHTPPPASEVTRKKHAADPESAFESAFQAWLKRRKKGSG